MNPAFAIKPQTGQMGGYQALSILGTRQQIDVGHQQIQKHIFATLQNQGLCNGWQANVKVNERAAHVKLLVDLLRLLHPSVELPRALEVALRFERKCFSQSSSKEDYDREYREKLGKIRDQRAQQVNQTTANMGTGPMQMPHQNIHMQMGQNMGQKGQHNMASNMNSPPTMQQMQHFSLNRPESISNQAPMMRNQPSFPFQTANQPNPGQGQDYSAEHNKAINLRAAELAKNTPKEKIRTIVEQMNPQLRATLDQRGVDPVIYYLRIMASKDFRRQKAMETGMGSNQMQNSLRKVPNQQQNQNHDQATNQPYGNGMGRYTGQEAEGPRPQEEGKMVVPVSNNPSMSPGQVRFQQELLANSQSMGYQNLAVTSPGYLEQQCRLEQQATKMLQATRFQGQAQETTRAQAGARVMPNQVQIVPQTNTPLSALNRPVNLGAQGVSPQPASRRPSRTLVMGPQGQMWQVYMQEAQSRESRLAQNPVHIQNILRQKPTAEWKAPSHAIQQRQTMRRNASSRPPGMHQQQTPQLQNGAFVGRATPETPTPQTSSAGARVGQNGMKSGMPGMPPSQGQMNPEMFCQQQAAYTSSNECRPNKLAKGSARMSTHSATSAFHKQPTEGQTQSAPGQFSVLPNQMPTPNSKRSRFPETGDQTNIEAAARALDTRKLESADRLPSQLEQNVLRDPQLVVDRVAPALVRPRSQTTTLSRVKQRFTNFFKTLRPAALLQHQ